MWDYPRPPAVQPFIGTVRVVHAGQLLVETTRAIRVLETSQPPAFYLPPADIDMSRLSASSAVSWCEWKGPAAYWTLDADGPNPVADAGWSYPRPTERFEDITDYVALYAQKLDGCWVDDEQVLPNPGMFYGGWITSSVVGPFKGGPGSQGW